VIFILFYRIPLMIESKIHLMLLFNDGIRTVQLVFILGNLALKSLYDLLRFLVKVIEILELILTHSRHLLLHPHYLCPLFLPLLR